MEELLTQAFYTPDEVADILKVNVQSIRRLIKADKLKAVKVGKVYRISKTDLLTFLNGNMGQ